MTVDRNNRGHKPKGVPDGGRYEPGGRGAAADDVKPPVPPYTSGTIRITGAGTDPLVETDRFRPARLSAVTRALRSEIPMLAGRDGRLKRLTETEIRELGRTVGDVASNPSARP